MGYNWIFLGKSEELVHLLFRNLVHLDIANSSFTILHIYEVLTIKIKRYMVLGELEAFGAVGHKHVILQIRYVDGRQIVSSLIHTSLHMDSHYAIILLMEQSVTSLTVAFMLPLIHVVNNQDVIFYT